MPVTPLVGMSDLKKHRTLPGGVSIIRPWTITAGSGFDILRYDDQETLLRGLSLEQEDMMEV